MQSQEHYAAWRSLWCDEHPCQAKNKDDSSYISWPAEPFSQSHRKKIMSDHAISSARTLGERYTRNSRTRKLSYDESSSQGDRFQSFPKFTRRYSDNSCNKVKSIRQRRSHGGDEWPSLEASHAEQARESPSSEFEWRRLLDEGALIKEAIAQLRLQIYFPKSKFLEYSPRPRSVLSENCLISSSQSVNATTDKARQTRRYSYHQPNQYEFPEGPQKKKEELDSKSLQVTGCKGHLRLLDIDQSNQGQTFTLVLKRKLSTVRHSGPDETQ